MTDTKQIEDWCDIVAYAGDTARRVHGAFLDITGAGGVDIQISADEATLWINDATGCRVRICRIRGGVSITDLREQET